MLLALMITIPLAGIVLLLGPEGKNYNRKIGEGVALINVLLSSVLWLTHDTTKIEPETIVYQKWISIINLPIYLGVDGLSIIFIALTNLLTLLCIYYDNQTKKKRGRKLNTILLLLLQILVILTLSSLNFLLFYIFFESTLIPMFLILGIWGGRSRKIKAAYYLLYYTLVGSLLMLSAILYLQIEIGSTDINDLLNIQMPMRVQVILWGLIFIGLATKVPIIPLHLWLPEAHVEAPTSGSVMLAGIILKIGCYGMLRFLIPVFPQATQYLTPIIMALGTIGVIYTSLITLRQIDLKKIIAYSSIAHMNLAMLGIFSNNIQGIEGAIMLLLGHGIVSSALFLLIGMLYERHNTRLLMYYSGLTSAIPKFSSFFILFSFANMALPGTSNFIGEILVLFGLWSKSKVVAFLVSWGLVLTAAYTIWLCNRINFGVLKTKYIKKYKDLTREESILLAVLAALTIGLGIYPTPTLNLIHMPVLKIITQSNLTMIV